MASLDPLPNIDSLYGADKPGELGGVDECCCWSLLDVGEVILLSLTIDDCIVVIEVLVMVDVPVAADDDEKLNSSSTEWFPPSELLASAIPWKCKNYN